MLLFIENLNFLSLIKLLFIINSKNNKIDKIFYFDISNYLKRLNWIFNYVFKKKIIKLDFSYIDIKDDKGNHINYNIITNEYQKIWAKLNSLNIDSVKNKNTPRYLSDYINKSMLNGWPSDNLEKPLKILLLLFQVALAKSNNNKILFLIDNRICKYILQQYASSKNIKLISLRYPIKSIVKSLHFFVINNFIFLLFYNLIIKIFSKTLNLSLINKSNNIIIDQVMPFFKASLFWSSINKICEKIIFVSKNHKIEQSYLDDIKSMNMNYISLSFYASNNLKVQLYSDKNLTFAKTFSTINYNYKKSNLNFIEKQFNKEKFFWKNFFYKSNAKIYGTHEKWSSKTIPAIAAMNEIGGVSFLWQTSYYEFSNPAASVNSDIYFCFSPTLDKPELLSNSNIKYLVSVGYIFDNHFEILKQKSKELKNQLRKNGAKKIIAFFDGGSSVDERWGYSNNYYEEDYKFLLDKLLNEKWLGLIIKSKKPGILKSRLKKHSELLNKAILSGRCILLTKANHIDKDLETRPALAAMASDLSIHQRLDAGSAGIEAALSGSPTLMFDRFNLTKSQFYNNNNAKNIVFNDWNSIWQAIINNWNNNDQQSLGDWGNIINNIDPYRDGKAGERMISYINFIHNCLNNGMSSNKAMESAFVNYEKKWGNDKLIRLYN